MDLLSLSRRARSLVGEGGARAHLITSPCTYYHYLCDNTDDRGWGCGYRSVQSLCSWAVMQKTRKQAIEERGRERDRGKRLGHDTDCEVVDRRRESASVGEWTVPSVRGIQETLVEVGDKPAEFAGSREWIGCFEACLVLDHLFSVACKIVHVPTGTEVVNYVKMLAEHFDSIGSPVMIGGDVDSASKTLIGVLVDHSHLRGTRFLVADPHYVCDRASEDSATLQGTATTDEDALLLSDDGSVRWHGLDLFQDSSFYNFCLPQTPT